MTCLYQRHLYTQHIHYHTCHLPHKIQSFTGGSNFIECFHQSIFCTGYNPRSQPDITFFFPLLIWSSLQNNIYFISKCPLNLPTSFCLHWHHHAQAAISPTRTCAVASHYSSSMHSSYSDLFHTIEPARNLQNPKFDYIMSYFKYFNGFSMFLSKSQISVMIHNVLHGLAPFSISILTIHHSFLCSHSSHYNFLPIFSGLYNRLFDNCVFITWNISFLQSFHLFPPGSLSHPQTSALETLPLRSLPWTSSPPLNTHRSITTSIIILHPGTLSSILHGNSMSIWLTHTETSIEYRSCPRLSI